MSADPRRELKVDGLLAVILTLASFGYENLDLPHSKAVGFGSFGVCLLLALRIFWISKTVFVNAANVTFKDASAFTWWRRQVIKYDISGMDAYFVKLEIPVPLRIPPLTVNEENQRILNPPHLYRGELSIPRLQVKNRKLVTHVYAVYVMQKAFPDPTMSPGFFQDLPKNVPQLFLTTFFSAELRKYFHASYWKSIEPDSPPGALLLWKIRETLGQKFTDKLVSQVYRVAADSLTEISDPDINVALANALKIADEIVEAYRENWPKIQEILDENRINVQFTFGPTTEVSGP